MWFIFFIAIGETFTNPVIHFSLKVSQRKAKIRQ